MIENDDRWMEMSDDVVNEPHTHTSTTADNK